MSFHVRDRRATGWFWIDNEIVDRFLPTIGVYGFAVYNVLARFSKNGETFVSHQTIGRAVKCSSATVKTAIESLMEHGLLSVKSGKDKGVHNIYFLLTPPAAEKKPGDDTDTKDNLVFLPGGKVIEKGSQQAATPTVATEQLPPSQEGSQQKTDPVAGPAARGSLNDTLPNIEEQDCKTNKTKNKVAGAPELVIPDWIDLKAWNGYLDMRKRLKKPATPRAQELVIARLGKFREKGLDPNAALEQSEVSCWTDVYEPKQPQGGRNGHSNGSNVAARTQRNRDAAAEVIADIERQDRGEF